MMEPGQRAATGIVLRAIRKYAGTIVADVEQFHLDAERTEELDAAIRTTRTMRCAASLIGSFALSRLVVLLEDLLERVAAQEYAMDEEALGVLMEMLASIDAYAERVEYELQDVSNGVPEIGDELVAAVKAFRRFRKLPVEDDDAEIDRILFTSGIGATSVGVDQGRRADDTGTVGSGGVSHTVRHDEGDVQPTSPVEEEGVSEALVTDEISPELREVFQMEAEELIERIYAALTQLEADSEQPQAVQEIRRAAHTLKGAAGAVGLKAVSRLAHRMEDLLDTVSESSDGVTRQHQQLLTATVDMLHDMAMGDLSAEQQEKLKSLYSAYREECAAEENGTAETGVAESNSTTPAQVSNQRADLQESDAQGKALSSSAPSPQQTNRADFLRVPAGKLHKLGGVVSELVVNRISMEQEILRVAKCVDELSPIIDRLRELRRDFERHDGVNQPCGAAASHPNAFGADVGMPLGEADDMAAFDSLEFDRFTNRDLWSQALSESTSDFTTIWQDLRGLVHGCESLLADQRRLTQNTQDRLLHIQMVPFGTIVAQLKRTVREAATVEEKEVEFVVHGEDVELDKTVLERTIEPLLHLLRNAVSHGVERSDERMANGKQVRASVRVSVVHFGMQVIVRISDDGRGLDEAKLRAAAVRGSFLGSAEAEECSAQDLYRLIFHPGFTTASNVNEVSGRGVGMDVVQSKIQELKGRIDIDSTPGEGTIFTVRLPVSLATTRALVVNVGDELFAIPQRAVTSIQRRQHSEVKQQDECRTLSDGVVDIPLIRLATHLGLASVQDAGPGTILVAMLDVGDRQVAVEVDGILPTREIVVRGLGDHLASIRGLLGATILGDGRVVPILDPTDLVHQPLVADGKSMPLTGVPVGTSRPLSVMIVDDSVSVRRVMESVIENAGWTPIAARDGVEALEILDVLERSPDVFLLDVEMPRMNGFQLLAALRERQAFERTPIIMITSRSGDKHRQQAMTLGASEYVCKPVHEEALTQIIQQQLAEGPLATV